MNIQEFISNNHLSMVVKTAKRNPNMVKSPYMTRHFTCMITNDETLDSMKIPFSQGSAHTKEPTLGDVLECLASDVSLVSNCTDFADFILELGIELTTENVAQHRKSYRATVRQKEDLEELIGADNLETLMYEVAF